MEELKAADESLDENVYDILGVDRAVEAFVSYGSTAPKEVRSQIQRWKARVLEDSAAKDG
jgi:argininosuccinate lyase